MAIRRPPDQSDPPTWFYHTAVNSYDTHRGARADCAICAKAKPLRPMQPLPQSLPYEEAIRLIELEWQRCAGCSASLPRSNLSGYCAKCWSDRKKTLAKITWEEIQ